MVTRPVQTVRDSWGTVLRGLGSSHIAITRTRGRPADPAVATTTDGVLMTIETYESVPEERRPAEHAVRVLGSKEVRDTLSERLDETERGVHIKITWRNRPRAVLVPPSWYSTEFAEPEDG